MFIKPEEIIKKFNLEPGMVVADFGAGAGVWSIPMGKIVSGGDGRVYAIDIQKDLLSKLKNEAEREGLKNIEIIWNDLEREGKLNIESEVVDFVIMSNLLFQMKNKEIVVREAFRILKNRGRMAVIDWSGSFGGLGPQENDIFSKEEARRIFMETGLLFEDEFSAGENHYGLIFRKP